MGAAILLHPLGNMSEWYVDVGCCLEAAIFPHLSNEATKHDYISEKPISTPSPMLVDDISGKPGH